LAGEENVSASAILKLQSAGFSAEQVTAIADLVDTQSATRADIEAVEHRLGLQMAEFRAAAKADLDAVDRRLDLKIAGLEGRTMLLQWMMGFILAFQVLIFGKLFLH
jgi:hypothetical protein